MVMSAPGVSASAHVFWRVIRGVLFTAMFTVLVLVLS